jgi:hypothetical protein
MWVLMALEPDSSASGNGLDRFLVKYVLSKEVILLANSIPVKLSNAIVPNKKINVLREREPIRHASNHIYQRDDAK